MKSPLIIVALLFAPHVLLAAEPPAKVLDLSRWKLTLPVDTDRPETPDEILQAELASFVEPKFFFVDAAGDGVVFRAPCGGSTSKGSGYPRCELREMAGPGKQNAAWNTTGGGTHTLTMKLAVTNLPPVKPHVVCAQIHDAKDDVLMVRLEGKKLLIEREREPDVLLARDYKLGTPFELKIQAGDGSIQLWHDGGLKLDWKTSRTGCYFKAGCYTQSNLKTGDAADAYGEVIIYRLQVEHP